MNKLKAFVFIGILGIFLTACGNPEEIKISFVPSAPAEDIMNATKPLEKLIIGEMNSKGYDIKKVTINVGTNYEAVGEALASGTTDIGFIPGGTYVLYEDQGVEPILTATRDDLDIDSTNPKDWNVKPEKYKEEGEATYYRSLILAGPSEKGKELSNKINNDEELTFEELNSAKFCLQSPSSSSGYLYPAQMLAEKYDKKIGDLSTTVTTSGYGDALGRLASGQCDVAPIYSAARMDYAKDWKTTYGRENSIFDETNVIGVSNPIMNDTISISKNSPLYSEDFIKDFQEAMISIAKTEEGKKVIDIYSHKGYVEANPKDYDDERKIQEDIIE